MHYFIPGDKVWSLEVKNSAAGQHQMETFVLGSLSHACSDRYGELTSVNARSCCNDLSEPDHTYALCVGSVFLGGTVAQRRIGPHLRSLISEPPSLDTKRSSTFLDVRYQGLTQRDLSLLRFPTPGKPWSLQKPEQSIAGRRDPRVSILEQ